MSIPATQNAETNCVERWKQSRRAYQHMEIFSSQKYPAPSPIKKIPNGRTQIHVLRCYLYQKIFLLKGTCNYHRIVYNVGDSFNSTDGCNTCHCTSHGVSCTEMFCGVLHPTVQQASRYLMLHFFPL